MNTVSKCTKSVDNHQIDDSNKVVDQKCYIDQPPTSELSYSKDLTSRKIDVPLKPENYFSRIDEPLIKNIRVFIKKYRIFLIKIQDLIHNKINTDIINKNIPNSNDKWTDSTDLLRYPIARTRLITEFSKELRIEQEVEDLKNGSVNELQTALHYSKNIKMLVNFLLEYGRKRAEEEIDLVACVIKFVEGIAVYLTLHGYKSIAREKIAQAYEILKDEFSYAVVFAFSDALYDAKKEMKIW